ncbi:MAG: Hpt domain-containing protein [Proteobacteria bacterium]|nr:MAG: Hpt domain-containing protein [Pseudomonadota bacterium]
MGYTMVIPEEMRKKYLERRRRDIEELSTASEAADTGPFIRVGHQLKGNALTFGYQELADVGARMEEAALAENWEEARACLSLLKSWWEKQA